MSYAEHRCSSAATSALSSPSHVSSPQSSSAPQPFVVPFFVNRLAMMPDCPRPWCGITLAELLACGSASHEQQQSPSPSTHPRDDDDDNNDVWQLVVAANYMVDFQWMLRAAPGLRKAQRILVLSGEKDNDHIVAAAHAAGLHQHRFSIVKPPLPIPYGTHHTKCLLCVSRTGIRIVVCTANFICDDWERKTQGIYVQDFPRRSLQTRTPPSPSIGVVNDFADVLKDYLQASGVPLATLRELIDPFDFSSACVSLVPSIPGYHKTVSGATGTTSPPRYGMHRLAYVLQRIEQQVERSRRHGVGGAAPLMTLVSSSNLPSLSWQYSSQGSLTIPFLKDLTTAMLSGPTVSGRGLLHSSVAEQVTIAVHFPTVAQVRSSLEGWRGGASIPVYMKNCHPFVNERLYKWACDASSSGVRLLGESSSQREYEAGDHPRCRAMPHIKTYVKHSNNAVEWLLLTSANLSRAAWGEQQRQGAQLGIRSYELGVVYHHAFPYEEVEVVVVGASSSRTAKSFSCMGEPWWIQSTYMQPITSAAALGGLKVHPLHKSCAAAPLPVDPTAHPKSRPTTTRSTVVLLPYNVFNPVPYASTLQLQQHQQQVGNKGRAGGAAVSSSDISRRDVPWTVDAPYGGVDSLGRSIDVLLTYSHYGPTSWDAPTLDFRTWMGKPQDVDSGLTGTAAKKTLLSSTVSASRRQHLIDGSSKRMDEVIDVDADTDDVDYTHDDVGEEGPLVVTRVTDDDVTLAGRATTLSKRPRDDDIDDGLLQRTVSSAELEGRRYIVL